MGEAKLCWTWFSFSLLFLAKINDAPHLRFLAGSHIVELVEILEFHGKPLRNGVHCFPLFYHMLGQIFSALVAFRFQINDSAGRDCVVFFNVVEAHQLPLEQVELPRQRGIIFRSGCDNIYQAVLLVECILDYHAAEAVRAERCRPLYFAGALQSRWGRGEYNLAVGRFAAGIVVLI